MKKAVLMYMVLGMGLFLLAPAAKATTIVPGQTVSSISAANVNGAGLASVPWTSANYPGTKSMVIEYVIADSTNPFGVGDLSFLYEVQVSKGDVGALTAYNFAGVQTAVEAGCEIGGALLSCTGAKLPTSAYRTSDGQDIQFNFSPFLKAGQWSYSLIIATNATSYDNNGDIGVIDGGGASVTGYEPIATPEPATLSLIGMGLLGLLGLRKKAKA